MTRWDDSIVGEYRVVWRWREKHDSHATYPVRRKGYKTRAGAERMLALLQSDGGEYEKIDDPNDYGRDGDFIATTLVLDFARLETREVGPWHAPCICGEYVADSSGEGGCGNCGADVEPLPVAS